MDDGWCLALETARTSARSAVRFSASAVKAATRQANTKMPDKALVRPRSTPIRLSSGRKAPAQAYARSRGRNTRTRRVRTVARSTADPESESRGIAAFSLRSNDGN